MTTEELAEFLYNKVMRFDRMAETPDWVIKGNSDAQVECRRAAISIMERLSHET